jgi:hypothetical protein
MLASMVHDSYVYRTTDGGSWVRLVLALARSRRRRNKSTYGSSPQTDQRRIARVAEAEHDLGDGRRTDDLDSDVDTGEKPRVNGRGMFLTGQLALCLLVCSSGYKIVFLVFASLWRLHSINLTYNGGGL